MMPHFTHLNKFIVVFVMLSLNSCYYSQRNSYKLYEEARLKSYDMIIVPGVPFSNNEWDKVMRGRILWAKYLYDQGIAKNIMFSGSAVYTEYTEAEIMAMYAVAIGIPKENVFVETMAEHSTENIYYSYKKTKQLGFKSIALASDNFQTRTLRRFVKKKVDPEVGLIPWILPIVKKMDTLVNIQIDFQKAYIPNFKSIKKRETLFKRLRGTWGLQIDEELYK